MRKSGKRKTNRKEEVYLFKYLSLYLSIIYIFINRLLEREEENHREREQSRFQDYRGSSQNFLPECMQKRDQLCAL